METTAPIPEPPTAVPPPPASSLAGKLVNVLAAPGEVFTGIAAAPARVANWLVPVLIYAVVGVISVCILFAQPAIQQTIRDQQIKALDQQVQQGKMTQAQEDQALQVIDRFMGPTMLAVFGSVAMVLYSFASIFWWALVLWLLGRWFLKARLGYLKVVEIAGLASVILVLGIVVATFLAVILGRLYGGPSLGLLVSDFDPTKRVHLLLGAANIIYFWHTAVLGFGLAKLSGGSTTKAVMVVFTYWVVAELLLIAVGLGQWTL
ncbi:MAG TPA: YIP1 family protein [Candidatus Sulfopaludibacter sp.]|nr:YIP1 family protein [Candidatus Sulfopaludibacter sp.]